MVWTLSSVGSRTGEGKDETVGWLAVQQRAHARLHFGGLKHSPWQMRRTVRYPVDCSAWTTWDCVLRIVYPPRYKPSPNFSTRPRQAAQVLAVCRLGRYLGIYLAHYWEATMSAGQQLVATMAGS